MITLAIHDTANEATEARLTSESAAPVEALWAMALALAQCGVDVAESGELEEALG